MTSKDLNKSQDFPEKPVAHEVYSHKQFLKSYWESLITRYPDIPMEQPKEIHHCPIASTIISLGKEVLPPNVTIYHKFIQGFVEMKFERLGKHAEKFINHFKSHLVEEAMIVQENPQTVTIRINVPKLNTNASFDELQREVHFAQDAIKKLLDWFRTNFSLWVSFYSNVHTQ